ncbi:MAG: hypothetical protein KAG66_21050, partial [Methylococcales bacterium]|nr:hypothetical protein [Methylococcales bacterium]
MQMDKTSSFPSTCWTDIRKAGNDNEEGQAESFRAMDSICTQYWQPIYSYARRRGWNQSEAEDQAQIFFHYIITSDLLRKADPL